MILININKIFESIKSFNNITKLKNIFKSILNKLFTRNKKNIYN